MSIFIKSIQRVLIVFCAIILILLLIGYHLASRSLPKYNQTLSSTEVVDKIEIIRDSASIPHIFSKNNHDAFFALGYAHAQDRFWQLNILRRSAQGRLSELFGKKTVFFDEFIRRIDIYNLARLSFNHQSKQAKSNLKSIFARNKCEIERN